MTSKVKIKRILEDLSYSRNNYIKKQIELEDGFSGFFFKLGGKIKNKKILREYRIIQENYYKSINNYRNFLLKELKQSKLKKFLNIVNLILESKFTTVIVRYYITISVIWFSLMQHHVFLKSLIIGYCSHIVLDYIMQYMRVKTGKDIENKIVYHFLGWGSILSLLFLISQYVI